MEDSDVEEKAVHAEGFTEMVSDSAPEDENVAPPLIEVSPRRSPRPARKRSVDPEASAGEASVGDEVPESPLSSRRKTTDGEKAETTNRKSKDKKGEDNTGEDNEENLRDAKGTKEPPEKEPDETEKAESDDEGKTYFVCLIESPHT